MAKRIVLKVYGAVDPKLEKTRIRKAGEREVAFKAGFRKVRSPFETTELDVSPKRALTNGVEFELERKKS